MWAWQYMCYYGYKSMATQGVVVTPYVFSDYSQWERKRTCILKKNHSCITVKRNQINNT